MRKFLGLFLILALVLVASVALATIAGTPHDFSGGGFDTIAGATVCSQCHIPHGGSTATANLPLWARSNPAGSTYIVYGSNGVAGTPGSTPSGTTVNAPGTFSLTCLSCHDGTLGINTVTKNGVAFTSAMTANSSHVNAAGFLINVVDPVTGYNPDLTKDLRNDHPVGLSYRGVFAGSLAGLQNSTVNGSITEVVNGANIYPLFTVGAVTTTMECATCHNPHDFTNAPFLRGPKATICQDCHATK